MRIYCQPRTCRQRAGNNMKCVCSCVIRCLCTSNHCHSNRCKAPVTLSRFKPRFTTTHPDLRQMVKSGCIGMRRDGKKEIPASIRCLTMLLRCLHDSSTDPLRLKTAALRFTTVELRMLTMPPRFDTVLVRFKPVALR